VCSGGDGGEKKMMDAYDGKSKQRKETHMNMLNWFTCTTCTLLMKYRKRHTIYAVS
jgi:hypothetical protein